MIELVVALAIVALAMSFLPGTIQLGQRIWQAGDALSEDEALDAFKRIGLDRLAAARADLERDPRTGRVALAFIGEPARVSFVAETTVGPEGAGLYRFEIDTAAASGTRVPRMRQETLARSGQATVAEHRSPVQVGGLAFRYFGAKDGAAEPAWHAAWLGQTTLPHLVEIAVITVPRGKTERHLVELKLGRHPVM